MKDDADKTQSVLNIGMFQRGKLPAGKDVGASTSTSHEASDTESRKRKHGSEEDVGHEEPGPSKKAKLNDGDEIDVNDEAMDVTDQDGGEVEISQIETTSSEKMDNLPISRRSTATEMSEKEIEKPSTDEKLDTILATLSQLKLNCENAQKISSEPEKADIKSNEESDIEAVKVLIQSCKSISRLCDLANLILSEDVHVSCVVCTTTDRHIGQGQGHGVFKYDFSLGVDFTTENQPLAFTNLKKSVARHLSTQTHKNNLLKADEDTTFARKQNILNQSVGLTLGKQAYRILKYGRPFKDFEVDMVLLSDAKVKVGNLNHSEKFAAGMRPAFATAINERVETYFKQPLPATSNIPPIGIVADKVTTKRRTGQLFAGVVFTPGMPSLLTPISLGVTPVKKHDGKSIAEEIHLACSSYDIQSSQIAGFGFDGQYFKLNVPTYLRDTMKLDEKVGFLWDSAHLLQLSDKDTRKENPWMEDIAKDIAAVLNKFSFGKNFENAIDKAAAMGVDLKAPQWFSDTRFAAFAHTVFRNFLDNYKVVRAVLEEVAESNDVRAPDACDLLRRIRTLDFVTKLLICIDFYSALGDISMILQKVDMTLWDKGKKLKSYLATLEEQQAWGKEHLQDIPCL